MDIKGLLRKKKEIEKDKIKVDLDLKFYLEGSPNDDHRSLVKYVEILEGFNFVINQDCFINYSSVRFNKKQAIKMARFILEACGEE
jgi:hypothetical protein